MRSVEKQFMVPDDYQPVPAHPQDAEDGFYQRMVRVAKTYFRLKGTTTILHGLEHLPTDGGALLAINHTGYFDFVLAGMGPYLRGKRLVRFMAKKEVFSLPVIGWLMRSMRHVPVDRSAGRGSIDEAVRWLREGAMVGIFPEGTISKSFELAHFKTGAARIAQQAGTPLIPCVIWGSQRIWTKDLPKKLGRAKIPVIIRYGAPVPLDGSAEEVTERLKRAMAELLDASRSEYNTRFGPFAPGTPWLPASLGGGAPPLEKGK